MSAAPAPARPRAFAWWAILCLVGLDYFSTIAYLPSVAVDQMGDLAPLAAAAVVLVTLLGALPVYWYVAGRSPHGKGGVGLLETNVHRWRGKVLILVLLGFVATDYVLTRSLSVSDAATHILSNPAYQERAAKVVQNSQAIRNSLPAPLRGRFFDFWNEQLVLSVVLTVLAFGLYFFLVRSLSRGFLGVAVAVVLLYLAVNAVVIGSGLVYLSSHPVLFNAWQGSLRPDIAGVRAEGGSALGFLAVLGLMAFPSLAIGLSGFELTLASAPLVRGDPGDDERHPRGRIRRTRLLLVVAAVIMCVLVLSSVLVVTLLVPRTEIVSDTAGQHVVHHRALAYLAHGSPVVTEPFGAKICPLFGLPFGTLYDVSTVLVLCLAGASATVSMRELVPDFLDRFGMQMGWAHKINVITHLFNVVILLVTVLFRASVSAQLGAYAASVLALLFGASLAATLDAKHRWPGASGWLLRLPFGLATVVFALMGLVIVVQSPSGVAIALVFVVVVLFTAIMSRWLRSTELRFVEFAFADEATRQRWEEICTFEFQVLVPHDPHHGGLVDKEAEMRTRHRLGPEVPIIFIEAHLGDPSDFLQTPVMQIDRVNGQEVIRVTRCTSIAHVIAAIGLAFREVGRPPELHFNWSDESPMAANLHFLLLGQGNIPWMVHELMRKAEKDEQRRPLVFVG